ncbi:MAG: alcohol dehydrogenase catalytic domain-containing protein [Sphingobium sp.]|nr:alcohol dehydrogenase catalytic domain-containing protein [Sphingobium sp.]
MLAVVMEDFNRPLALQTVADPTPGNDEVVVQVARCGICGSDLHMSEDPAYGQQPGAVFGHEFAGEVVALGRSVDTLKLGDRVAVRPLKSCGQCAACQAGKVQWCESFGLQGGGYAEYALTHWNQCVRLPAAASMADGAIAEPLAVALHGVNLSGMRMGDRVLIVGAGPIGLAAAYWARRLGAGRVVVQDIADWQRERAMQLGAHDFIADAEDPVGASERALGGKADIVFECVGAPGLIDQAVKQVRNSGTVLLLGLCMRPQTLNSFYMLTKEVRLITSAFFVQQEFEAALDALGSGAVEPRYLVTDTISLEATPAVFESLKKRTHQCKVLIAPTR